MSVLCRPTPLLRGSNASVILFSIYFGSNNYVDRYKFANFKHDQNHTYMIRNWNRNDQAWSILRNRGKKPIRIDSILVSIRLESIRHDTRKSRNITENFDSISDFIYACFQKNRCYFDIIEI